MTESTGRAAVSALMADSSTTTTIEVNIEATGRAAVSALKTLVVPSDKRFLQYPAASNDLLEIVGVDPQYKDLVRVIDSVGSLVLLHYVTMYNSKDTLTINVQPLEYIGHVRGTIIDTMTNQIVCKSPGYTFDVLCTQTDELGDIFANTEKFQCAYEGTMLRLFTFNGVTYLSSHHKIDAYKSKWGGLEFGSMFDQVRKFSMEQINQENCYVFLLSHPDSRLVLQSTEPALTLITVYSPIENRFLLETEYTPPPGSVIPEKLTIGNVGDLVALVNDMDPIHGESIRAGVLCTFPNGKTYKIINPNYQNLHNIRGNAASIKSRYLQIRGTPEAEILKEWWSECGESFEIAEKQIQNLAASLLRKYVARYIKKNFENIPKEEFVTIRRCHEWHLTDRKANKVTHNVVMDVLNNTPNYYITIMLKAKGT